MDMSVPEDIMLETKAKFRLLDPSIESLRKNLTLKAESPVQVTLLKSQSRTVL
jgi:hypothetical protein